MRIPNVPERVKEVPAQALRAVFAGIGQALLVSDRVRRRLKEQGGGADHRPPAAKAPVTGPDSAEQAMKARAPGSTVSRPAADAPAAAAQAAPAAAQTPAAKPAPAKPVAAQPAPAKPAPAKPAPAKPAAAKPAPAKPAATQPAPAKPAPAKPAPGKPAATQPAPAKPAAAKPAPGKPAATQPAPAKPAPAAAQEPAAGRAAAQPAPAAEAPTAAPIENYDKLSFASLRARLRGLDQEQVRKLLVYERAHASRPDVISMYERRIEKLGETG